MADQPADATASSTAPTQSSPPPTTTPSSAPPIAPIPLPEKKNGRKDKEQEARVNQGRAIVDKNLQKLADDLDLPIEHLKLELMLEKHVNKKFGEIKEWIVRIDERLRSRPVLLSPVPIVSGPSLEDQRSMLAPTSSPSDQSIATMKRAAPRSTSVPPTTIAKASEKSTMKKRKQRPGASRKATAPLPRGYWHRMLDEVRSLQKPPKDFLYVALGLYLSEE